jgi:rubrerythrin
MYFETFEDIMEYAINKEKEAQKFYNEAAEQESFSGSKELFRHFALEERGHQKMLENFSKENFEHYKEKKIPDLKISDYTVELEYKPDMPYDDVLRLAAKREEKAFKFYTDFAERADQEGHKKVFKVLAQEESKHKLKLETLLDEYFRVMGD